MSSTGNLKKKPPKKQYLVDIVSEANNVSDRQTVFSILKEQEDHIATIDLREWPLSKLYDIELDLEMPDFITKTLPTSQPNVNKKPFLAGEYIMATRILNKRKFKMAPGFKRNKKGNKLKHVKKPANCRILECVQLPGEYDYQKKPIYYVCDKGQDVFNFKYKNQKKMSECIFLNLKQLSKIDYYFNNNINNTAILGLHENGVTRSKIICWIANSGQSACIPPNHWREYESIFEQCVKAKYNVPRSENKNNFFNSYICFGFQKDYSEDGVRRYTFKPMVPEYIEKYLSELIDRLVSQLEHITQSFFANSVTSDFKKLEKDMDLNKMIHKGIYTQFGIGTNFCSSVHIDNDYQYSTLCAYCYDPNHKDNAPIYYFNFPTYGITIPIYNGVPVVFDPMIPHSCSNPIYERTYIFSSYVSQKTINASIAEHLKKNCEQ